MGNLLGERHTQVLQIFQFLWVLHRAAIQFLLTAGTLVLRALQFVIQT